MIFLAFALLAPYTHVIAQSAVGTTPPPASLRQAIKLAGDYYAKFKLDSSFFWAQKALALAQDYHQPSYEIKARGYMGNVYLRTNQYDKALKAFNQNLARARVIKDDYYIAAYTFNKAIVFSKLGEYQKAIQNYKFCVKAFKQQKKEALVARMLNSLGMVYELQDQYQQAIYYHLESLKIYEKANHQHGLSNAYNNLALLEWKMGNIKQAKAHYKKAYALAQKVKNVAGQLSSLTGLGNISLEYKDYKAAENYYKQALKIGRQMNTPEGIADNLHNLGLIAQRQKKYVEAISYYEESLAIRKKLGDPERINLSTYNLASVYFKSKNYPLALQYGQLSLTQAKALGNKSRISRALGVISDIHYANEEYKKAYDFQKEYHAYLDSTLDQTKVKEIEKLKAVYKTERKQDSIAFLTLNLAKQKDSIQLKQATLELLQKDKDLQAAFFQQEQQKKEASLQKIAFEKAQQAKSFQVQAKNRQQEIKFLAQKDELNTSLLHNAALQKRNLLISGGIVILLLVVAAGWLFITQRQRTRLAKEKLKRQNVISQFEYLKHQVNPHFLLNSLNALASLIQQDSQKAHTFALKFSQLYLFVLELKDNLMVSLEEELKFCEAYLALQQIRFGDGLKIDYEINTDKSQVSLPPMALQIALENAVKHNQISVQAPLHIRVFEEAKKLVIQNNLQKKAAHIVNSTHIGVQNIKERYKLIGKEQPEFIESTTDFTVKLPLNLGG